MKPRVLLTIPFLSVACVLGANTSVQAQQALRIPVASPAVRIHHDFSVSFVELSYSRPSKKGREIFGKLEPYGQVWRTGANEATVFETSKDVVVEGSELPAGKYGLFTLVNGDTWTIIFNKTWKQWGAYEYKQADDVLRVNVKAKKAKAFAEKMTFDISKAGVVTLLWGDSQVSFNVK